MLRYFFVFTLLFIVHANFNSEPTYANAAHNTSGTQIAISPDETTMAVGFDDGTIKILSMEVYQVCQSTSSNNWQITDLIWLPSFGPISLDDSNTITLWSTDCTMTNQLSFNKSIRGIAGHEVPTQDENQTTLGVVAVNFQNRIEQFDIETGDQTMVYDVPQNEKTLEMIYNLDGESIVLLVSTNASLIRKFQTQNGTEIDNFETKSPILQMVQISVYTGDVVIGIAQNNDIIRFDSKGQMLDRGHYPKSASITICPTTKQFALAFMQSQSMSVYLYAGQIQQTITSLSSLPQDIDCSTKYLVSVQKNGSIRVYTYEEFKSYVIAIIAGVLGGLLALIIVVIVIIKHRQNLNKEKNDEKYKSTKANKYPQQKSKAIQTQKSVQMLKVSTLETTMRE